MLRKLLNLLNPGSKDDSGFLATKSAEVWIVEGDRTEAAGDLDEACRCYRNAVAAAPRYGKAWLYLGVALEAAGDSKGAIEAYETLIEHNTDLECVSKANFNLGKLHFTSGALDQAEVLLRSALRHRPDFPEAKLVLSSVYEAKGDLSTACVVLEEVLSVTPEWIGALLNYALILRKIDRLGEAETALRRITELDQQNSSVWNLLGDVLNQQEKRLEAASCYAKILELEPNSSEAECNLGNVLSDQRKWNEAINHYKRAISIKPDFAEAHVGLGNVLKNMGREEEAINCYKQALIFKPTLPEAHSNLAAVYKDQDHSDKALAHLREAIRLSPESAEMRWLYAMCQMPAVYEVNQSPQHCIEEFSQELRRLDDWFNADRLVRGVNAVGVQQPFYLAYQEHNYQDLLRCHGDLCVRIMEGWFTRKSLKSRPPTRRSAMRVGIVSGHFYDHPVWNAIVRGWFQHLDRDRFDIYGFYLDVKHDSETNLARHRATRFFEGCLGLREWVDAILDEQLDVLIYPEIGMDCMTLKLASSRLAPIQIATWGHPQTTGLRTIDYFLSAEQLEPADAQNSYTEKLIRLPNLGCCFQSLNVNSLAPRLKDFGIPGEDPLLICAGTPFKYAPQEDWIYPEIARRLGKCRFIFFRHAVTNMSEKLHRRLHDAFSRKGLACDDYVTFIPWQSRQSFYGWLRRADVFLDTIGFSGFNTAMQAVECAAPVVTKQGRFLRGRLASGILERMNLGDLVTHTDEDYIRLAVRIAQDSTYRARIRARLENSRSILFDDIAPIRAFELCIRDVVATRRSGTASATSV